MNQLDSKTPAPLDIIDQIIVVDGNHQAWYGALLAIGFIVCFVSIMMSTSKRLVWVRRKVALTVLIILTICGVIGSCLRVSYSAQVALMTIGCPVVIVGLCCLVYFFVGMLFS
jgi:hypothetical protein